MTTELLTTVAPFVVGVGLVLLVAYLLGGQKKSRLEPHYKDKKPQSKSQFEDIFMKGGDIFKPTTDEERTQLRARLHYAGLYAPNAMQVFLAAKSAAILLPLVIGMVAFVLGPASLKTPIVIISSILASGGIIFPTRYLDGRKKTRQVLLKRALPDALDLLVICLEAGLPLEASIRRVTGDLKSVHPTLASEMMVVQSDMQLGRPAGDALKSFADRCGLDEVETLSNVVTQAQKFGASMAETFRINSESLRMKRRQDAEAMARVAGTKILFPTILFIFPGLLLVILGPAMIITMNALSGVN